MSENSNEEKNEICDLLQSVSKGSIKGICDGFYFDIDKCHVYDQELIAKSLYSLLGKSPNKPIMLLSGALNPRCRPQNISDELNKMRSHGCFDKSIIFIRNEGYHFTVFYLFQKEKKILFIDPMGVTGKPDLKNEGYTSYVSNTKIQKDGYSCGVIASEIARMLYSNHEVVESYLSKRGLNCDQVSLDDFLPRKELAQLCKSFSEEITIDYGNSKKELKGADYRTAHLMCALTANVLYSYALMHPISFISMDQSVNEVPQEEKQKVEKIRSLFIGNPDNVKLFNQEVNKLLWPNKVVNSDIKVPAIKKDTYGKLETAPNNINSQQIKPVVGITNGLGSSGFSSQPEYGDVQNNSQQPSNPDENNVIPKSSQKSKWPAIAASMLAITGVATGIAIAVYLEMLAVGIAVGACCLVAAAIIYYCNRPSNLLKNSGAEALGNEVQKVVNPT